MKLVRMILMLIEHQEELNLRVLIVFGFRDRHVLLNRNPITFAPMDEHSLIFLDCGCEVSSRLIGVAFQRGNSLTRFNLATDICL